MSDVINGVPRELLERIVNTGFTEYEAQTH